MASITKNNGENKAEEESDDQAEDSRQTQPEPSKGGSGYGGAVAASAPSTGFFHIYKSGQGYWTRMGSAAAARGRALTIRFLCPAAGLGVSAVRSALSPASPISTPGSPPPIAPLSRRAIPPSPSAVRSSSATASWSSG
jgi:hypothetical protein